MPQGEPCEQQQYHARHLSMQWASDDRHRWRQHASARGAMQRLRQLGFPCRLVLLLELQNGLSATQQLVFGRLCIV